MKYAYLLLAISVMACNTGRPLDKVTVSQNSTGMRLMVNGEAFMINGMNWDYFPIGTNFTYSLWDQPDEIIKAALDYEMGMLKDMGVNTIRVYTGIPVKWIQYIYEEYSIYTMINHSFGRYGLEIDGTWVANTDYSDQKVKETLLTEVAEMVNTYKGTPGLLIYLLGNENNYGLFWEGAETEDIPTEDMNSTGPAKALYKLFNEATLTVKAIDSTRPVAICNGDLQYLELIAEECPGIDILGTNMYRGASFEDAFQQVREITDKPIMFTEFGADAYHAIKDTEDEQSQAYYLLNNWREIYKNAADLGLAGNSIGGFTFQLSDGWWKFGQTRNLNIHDTNASWSNGGYQSDYQEGRNNMNEEWFGICAKGETGENGLYELYPRVAYYMLQKAHEYDPYAANASIEQADEYFENIEIDSTK